MALATYTDLQTAIAEWMGAPGDVNTVARAADYIALFEAKVRRNYRFLAMSLTTILPVSTEFVTVPPGFIEMRSIFLLGSPSTELSFIGQDAIRIMYDESIAGLPQYYTVDQTQIQFAPKPDATYSAQISYYGFTPLSNANPTNWIMTNYPDLYLYGSLRESNAYRLDQESAALWDKGYAAAYQELVVSDSRSRMAPSASARPDIWTP